MGAGSIGTTLSETHYSQWPNLLLQHHWFLVPAAGLLTSTFLYLEEGSAMDVTVISILQQLTMSGAASSQGHVLRGVEDGCAL